MFTGLIEETGKILALDKQSNSLILTVEANKILNDIKIGDSVAINGVCETVIELNNNNFKVFVSSETLFITNFLSLKCGSIVNLERALKLSDRINGHIVTGHVDTTSAFLKKENIGDTTEFYFKLPAQHATQLIKKGSIAINGISLTIADIQSDVFKIAVIPHTLKNTNLSELKTGEIVNIETDLMAKYVEKYLS